MYRYYLFILFVVFLLSFNIRSGQTELPASGNCSQALPMPGFPIVSEDNRSFDFVGAANLSTVYPGKEIIARKSSQILIYSNRGEFLKKYDIPWIHAYAPAVADFNQDGLEEIIFGSRPLFYQGAVYAIDQDGLHVIKEEGVDSQPVVADLNGDGALEIIYMEYKTKAIHTIDRAGNDLIAPIDLNLTSDKLLHSPLAVGDLDRDGRKEIVVEVKEKNKPLAGWVRAFQSDGTLLWDVVVPHSYPINTAYNEGNELVLGDVDSDGFLDVVLFMVSANAYLSESHLMIFGPDGSLKNDWSVADTAMTFPVKAHQQIALSDLDADQTLEIILTGTHNSKGILAAYKYNGEPLSGFPIVKDDTRISTPRAADVNTSITLSVDTECPYGAECVNAGGRPKILALTQNDPLNPVDPITAQVWTAKGKESPCPLTMDRVHPGTYPLLDSPHQMFLDDVDGNGTLDGVVLLEGEIHAFDLGVGMTDVVGNLDWPMYGHDVRFTRNFEE